MKAKSFLLYCGLFIVFITTGYHSKAQMQAVKPEYITGKAIAADYTYKLFRAPDNMYGYDVFKNNKFIFHQPASFITNDKSTAALSTKEQADKAALLAIEKIKKGQEALLSQQEIKKITGQQ